MVTSQNFTSKNLKQGLNNELTKDILSLVNSGKKKGNKGISELTNNSSIQKLNLADLNKITQAIKEKIEGEVQNSDQAKENIQKQIIGQEERRIVVGNMINQQALANHFQQQKVNQTLRAKQIEEEQKIAQFEQAQYENKRRKAQFENNKKEQEAQKKNKKSWEKTQNSKNKVNSFDKFNSGKITEKALSKLPVVGKLLAGTAGAIGFIEWLG